MGRRFFARSFTSRPDICRNDRRRGHPLQHNYLTSARQSTFARPTRPPPPPPELSPPSQPRDVLPSTLARAHRPPLRQVPSAKPCWPQTSISTTSKASTNSQLSAEQTAATNEMFAHQTDTHTVTFVEMTTAHRSVLAYLHANMTTAHHNKLAHLQGEQ
jgi:hypothetical protein